MREVGMSPEVVHLLGKCGKAEGIVTELPLRKAFASQIFFFHSQMLKLTHPVVVVGGLREAPSLSLLPQHHSMWSTVHLIETMRYRMHSFKASANKTKLYRSGCVFEHWRMHYICPMLLHPHTAFRSLLPEVCLTVCKTLLRIKQKFVNIKQMNQVIGKKKKKVSFPQLSSSQCYRCFTA